MSIYIVFRIPDTDIVCTQKTYGKDENKAKELLFSRHPIIGNFFITRSKKSAEQVADMFRDAILREDK
jgi:hypothetical protein